jgi:hypothetical protein
MLFLTTPDYLRRVRARGRRLKKDRLHETSREGLFSESWSTVLLSAAEQNIILGARDLLPHDTLRILTGRRDLFLQLFQEFSMHDDAAAVRAEPHPAAAGFRQLGPREPSPIRSIFLGDHHRYLLCGPLYQGCYKVRIPQSNSSAAPT